MALLVFAKEFYNSSLITAGQSIKSSLGDALRVQKAVSQPRSVQKSEARINQASMCV